MHKAENKREKMENNQNRVGMVGINRHVSAQTIYNICFWQNRNSKSTWSQVCLSIPIIPIGCIFSGNFSV
jgi:hypothetical protein